MRSEPRQSGEPISEKNAAFQPATPHPRQAKENAGQARPLRGTLSTRYFLLASSVVLLFGWLFADALFSSAVFVFRDAGHYYDPLLEFVRNEWLAGRVPLWNPYENLGAPLAGNATASVFYPGVLILLLPIGFAWAYKLYVMAHVLLAAGVMYRLARHWQSSVEGATVAALSYAFCGNVLFQYANVVFLVGAAWLPAAVLAADRMLRERRPAWAFGLGVVLALMTLGGDPQMAYHAGLIGALYAFCLWWWERSDSLSFPRTDEKARFARSRPALLVLAAASGLVLAAVQVFPAAEFGRLSGRAPGDVPRTIYEIPRYLGHGNRDTQSGRRWSDGLTCRRFEPRSHHDDVYQFSVGPWRLAEYVWPNFAGRQFPVHRRWLDAIPAEGRVWVPSLYMGLLPLVLGLAAMRFRRADARTRWLSWLVVLALVGSLGWYGPGWLFREISQWLYGPTGEPSVVGAPVGGLYWLMTLVLPGYIYFRYPAKLLVLAALGLSLLAAGGWDRTVQGSAGHTRRLLALAGGASVAGLAVFAIVRPWWETWLQSARADLVFGPLDVAGATWDVTASLIQTAVLAGASWWLLGRAGRGARWAKPVLLLLIALDLGVANRWMVACAPSDCWQTPSASAVVVQTHRAEHDAQEPARAYRQPHWYPASWRRHASPSRLIEVARWERGTLFPKYNLHDRIALAEVQGTMMPRDYEPYWNELSREAPGSLAPIGVGYAILPDTRTWPGARRLGIVDVEGEEVAVWRAGGPAPRAWIAHPAEADPETIHLPPALPSQEPGSDGAAAEEVCRVVQYEPTEVRIAVRMTRPGLVILADQFYPGWRLEVETAGLGRRDVPIVRANRVMRGAWLPAGQHRLAYRYRPEGVLWGAMLSGLGWLGLAVVVARRSIRGS